MLMALGVLGPWASAVDAADKKAFVDQIDPILFDYCYDCHAEGMSKGDFSFESFSDLGAPLTDHDKWLAVWNNTRAQLMPPSDKDQPTDEQRKQLLAWIEHEVFGLDPENPDPGRVTIRRLNRREYRNTVRDLLNVNFDTNDEFPADDTGYGFDNIGDVLSLSPLLMEKYLDAAQTIMAEAVPVAKKIIPIRTVKADAFVSPNRLQPADPTALPFAKPAILTVAGNIPEPGRYRLILNIRVTGSPEATSHTAQLNLIHRGKKLVQRELGWDNSKNIALRTVVTFKSGPEELLTQLLPKSAPEEGEGELQLAIQSLQIQGPIDGSTQDDQPLSPDVFVDGAPPTEPVARAAYAKRILRHFGDRAFRRPIDDITLERYLSFVNQAASQPGQSFEQAIAAACSAMLASPKFLFRAEAQPQPDNPNAIVPIDEYALASRLSYFLWNSMPDPTLFDLARAGQLREQLDQQVDRMIDDPKADRFIESFVGQWLSVDDVMAKAYDHRRILGVRTTQEARRIFSTGVRYAMRQETELLFEHILRDDRSTLELLTADYTFLNQDLARFYGISGITGREMRKVQLEPDSNRGGVLTHASTLFVTSNPARTSPVKRGLFLLDNILGTPAPPAPENVPSFEETQQSLPPGTSTRRAMEIHREEPLCNSCHQRMDPLGLALENYNALGQWREDDRGKPIDSAGTLITGESFNNAKELGRVLANDRREDFYRCLVEKLLTYAIGRGVEYYDAPSIDRVVLQLHANDGAMRSLIHGIVQSAPFQKRRGDGQRFTAQADLQSVNTERIP